MRVLHVAAGNLYGGVERILEEIAAHAPAASRHEFALAFKGRVFANLSAAGATLHDLGGVRFSRPWLVWRARRRLKRLLAAGAFDAVIGHSPWAFVLAAPVVRLPRMALWAHDALDGRHWTERRVLRHTPPLVICNSQYTASAVGAWLTNVRREVVYAPVSPSAIAPALRTSLRVQLGAGERTTVIVLASRLEKWKGHAELLRAAAGLRGDWAIWIAGASQRPHEVAYERDLRKLAAALPVADRISFLGERRDVGHLFQAADIHCQPNTAPEPFGLVFVEALYAGVPVVTSDLGGAREIVTTACGMLLPPGNRGALTETLQNLIDDPPRRTVLGAAGPARAYAHCNPVAQIAALEHVLL
jgi:glycosyltransferase involved in cell wall biosynthesis